MGLAKKIAILGSFVSLMSIFSGNVSAQYNNAFKPFFDLMKYIMEDLAKEPIFRRFMIWMLLFTLLTIAAMRVFKDHETEKKRGNIIALILSLIMTIGIPMPIINLIFDEYSLVAFLAMYLIVPILLFIATKDMQNGLIRGIIFFVLGVLLMIAAAAVSSGSWAPGLKDFVTWLFVGASICMVAGIIMMFSGGSGEGGTGDLFGKGDKDTTTVDSPHEPKLEPGDISPDVNKEFANELIGKMSYIGDEVSIFKRDLDGLKKIIKKIENKSSFLSKLLPMGVGAARGIKGMYDKLSGKNNNQQE